MILGLAASLPPSAVAAPPPTPVHPAGGCGQTITAPGEYVLTGDLACTGAVSGVRIASSHVSFHLAGHTISNTTCDPTVTFAGIFVDGGLVDVEIEGGTVRGFNDGIVLSSSRSRVRGMAVHGACQFGILVQGAENRVVTNVASGNGDGIMLSPATGAVIASNNSFGNKRSGVALSDSASSNLIANNILANNGTSGGEGYGVVVFNGTGNVIRDNAANDNQIGIRIASAMNPGGSPALRNQVLDNTASGNAQVGIWVQREASPSLIRRNTVLGTRSIDMLDDSAACGANVWKSNVFRTDVVAGLSDGGPGTGCLK
jgi:parallel beta-helix repeat protein